MAIFELKSADYNEMRNIAGGAIVKGTYVAEADIHGFYGFAGGVSGDEMVIVTKASKVLVKKNAPLVIAVGDIVYFDVADDEVNKTPTANFAIGHCIEAALSADTDVLIDFDGSLAFAKI